eukprot:COSAG06_NODE_58290_length_277_cov_0.960674_1_plen_33_part_01
MNVKSRMQLSQGEVYQALELLTSGAVLSSQPTE